MAAAAVPTSSTYDALCEEFAKEAGALCGALTSENPSTLVDHLAKIFPADDLLIDELGCALQKTPPRPAFFEALRDELSASSGDSAATTDDAKLDEACQRAQAHVRLLSEAHYVNSSDLGIPRAEQDAEGELLLGVCRQCQVTRLLSSLEEHEAGCKPLPAPVPVPKQPASGTACLPAASEGLPSVSQGAPAPKKRAQQKSCQGRPQKRQRQEPPPPAAGQDALGSTAPWAAQQPAKRLPPLYPGTATGGSAQPVAEGPQQHPLVPMSSAPISRLKPVVKLKQPVAPKTLSSAAALNAAWADFPMPTDFMAEDLGSLPQSMDWLNSADLAAMPAKAAPEAAAGKPAAGKPAAKSDAKAAAKAAAAAAQKAAKRAAKKKRALAMAPNKRMGLFQPFTLHPRKKRSAAFKRRPRASLRAPTRQSGAFAEMIATLAGDSPSQQQQQRPAEKPRLRPSATQAADGPTPHMRHPAAYASLNALSAAPGLSTQQPQQDRRREGAPIGPSGQGGQNGQPRQLAPPHIPQEILQKAKAARSAAPIKEYLRQHMHAQRQHALLQQQRAAAGSPQQAASSQAQFPASAGNPAGLLGARAHSGPQQVPAPAGSMIPSSSQPQAQRLSEPHLRFVPNSQGEQSPGRLTQQPPQNAQQQQSVQHQEALRALYMQRTAQQIQGANAPVSQAASPLRRTAMQHPYSGAPVPAQSSNPMATVTSSHGYRQRSPQAGTYSSPSAMPAYPQTPALSAPHYMPSALPAARMPVSQALPAPAAQIGQPAGSYAQQQQQYASQAQRYFVNPQLQQQQGGMQYYPQQPGGLPSYLGNGSGAPGLANVVNPLKGSRLGNASQPEPSQTMRWIPTSITPPTDKLASVQQLNPIPSARPEDSAQPLMGQYSFRF